MEKKSLVRNEVKQIIASALCEVANFNGDIETCEYPRLGDYHKQLVRSAIAKSMATTGHGVSLSCTTIDSFRTFSEMIDYIHGEQGSALLPEAKIRLRSAKKQVRVLNLLSWKPVRELIPVVLVTLGASVVLLSGCRNDSSNPYGSTSMTPAQSTSTPGTVTIASFAFGPSSLTIAKNTTVTWMNDDGVVHTSTSNSGLWDTGDIQPGTSKTTTFATVGTFPFHCTHHSMMTGTIIVQ